MDFCLICVPFSHYDEPEILPYAINRFCPTGADVGHKQREPELSWLSAALSGFNNTDRKGLKGDWPCRVPPFLLGSLGFPILFIAGHLDPVFPVDAIRAVQAQAPGSFLVEVQDTGHSVFYERPVEFIDSLLRPAANGRVQGPPQVHPFQQRRI
jgi:pimeloyl-ACP methyl ester carboxylesterase